MSTLDGVDRARLGWWVGAVLLGGALTYVVYSFLGTFIFGVFVYYATRPVYRRLKQYVGPPSLAALVALLTLALPALLLLAYTVAVGLQELNAFLASSAIDLGQLESLLQPYFDLSEAVQDPETLLDEPSVQAVFVSAYESTLRYLGLVGTALLHLFVMITIAFYLLRDDHRLAAWFRRRFSDDRGVVEAYTRAVDRDFSNIFFGNILNAFLTGIIGAIAYTLIDVNAPTGVGLPYPALLGLLAGVASLVPVVGIKLVYVPVAAWLTFLATQNTAIIWFPVLFIIVSFVVVDVIPDLVLRPYVSGRGLHLGMVMLAYILGPLLFGWYGIFLGPMLLVLIVHFVRLILPELLAGREISPSAVGPDVWTADPESSHAGSAVSSGAADSSEEDDPDDATDEQQRDEASGADAFIDEGESTEESSNDNGDEA
ncbi:AI-2E family transporter [Halobacterium zhouii]|uniref:AI-2E family transporter n=1 Tax=Halobacterium zhouii TaxID=2902624 RepID=UPI001E60E6D1|nr:AI-2E family transporter [Halobacterium zhouii]